MATIDYYFTCASPFAYLGHRLICEVADKHRVELKFKPVNLFQIWDVSGARPPNERPEVRQRVRLVELQRMADFRGLPLNPKPKYWPVDASLADRVCAGLIEDGHDPRFFMGKVFGGLWAYEDNISDEKVLASYLSQCGLDPVLALREGHEAWTQAKRESNAREAIAADVVGVPTYVFGGEAFWGQDRIEHLDHALSVGRSPFHAKV